VVTLCTTSYNIEKFYVLSTQFIFVFRVDLNTNSGYVPIHCYVIGFCCSPAEIVGSNLTGDMVFVALLLRLWVRISPGTLMSVCCECCVLSGRGVCDELITRPEESYQLWRVVLSDLETSWMRSPWPTGGCCAKIKKELHSRAAKLLGHVTKD